MKNFPMEQLEKGIDELFNSIELRGAVAIQNFEKHGLDVITNFERKMKKAFTTFWLVIGSIVVIAIGYMIDSSKVMASKANNSDLINYAKTDAVIESFRLDYMMDTDCFVIRDTTQARRYEDRYMWQIETNLKKK